MSEPELTSAQRQVLARLPERVRPDRVDRLWIFTPHQGRSRETGLFVLSLFPLEGEAPGQRILLTLRYETEPVKREVQIHESIAEEGRAPPDLIERVIAGVLMRGADEAGEPLVEMIDGSEARWDALLERLGLRLDPSIQE